MQDKKDRSERIKYLNHEKDKQEERKQFYLAQIAQLKELIKSNQKEIRYNEGWVKFHEAGIEKHKENIREIAILDEKLDQEKKLAFHLEQIEKHHKEYIMLHKRELEFIEQEVKFFEKGIEKCDEQLKFLNRKIRENKI